MDEQPWTLHPCSTGMTPELVIRREQREVVSLDAEEELQKQAAMAAEDQE